MPNVTFNSPFHEEATSTTHGLSFKSGETKDVDEETAAELLTNRHFSDATGRNPNFVCSVCGKETHDLFAPIRGEMVELKVDGKRVCFDDMQKHMGLVPATDSGEAVAAIVTPRPAPTPAPGVTPVPSAAPVAPLAASSEVAT